MNLSGQQIALHDEVWGVIDATGQNWLDVLRDLDAPNPDKAVVAQVFGGAGAGDEFRRLRDAELRGE